MKYCKRCLYPANHPLNLTFNEEGVCSGCLVHEEKDQLDWEARKEKLLRIVGQYRTKSRFAPDCIIPVTGARDSHFIVHFVMNVLKLRPLLVSYNYQYNTHVGIRNLAYLRTSLGCDFVQTTTSPERVKRITLESLKKMGSMYWHCLAGSTVFPVQVAVRFKIPLIIWGVHQGIDQVGMFSHLDEVEMTRKYRKEHDLMGFEAEALVQNSDYITVDDMEQFIYPHDKELESVGVRGIYLNNYLRWDTKAQHEFVIEKYGYETYKQQRTFDTYNDVDSFHYSGIHDYIKFLKFGYGKVTDHACRELRLKRLTREDGIDLVKKYQDIYPSDLSLFLDWLQISKNNFWNNINAHRSPTIWEKMTNEKWTLKDSIINHVDDQGVDSVRLEKVGHCAFLNTPPRDLNVNENDYQLIGRGWVDKNNAK
jgi:N-acetyl sugar amidotransferase